MKNLIYQWDGKTKQIKRYALLILFACPQLIYACLPNEVYIKSHDVNSYQRTDGTIVREFHRSGYCRELKRSNYFRDSSSQKFRGISPKLKKWNESEKVLISKFMASLPAWLSKYAINEMLRADTDGTINPASSIPFTKTILIYDAFFKNKDQKHVIIHELAHIALWDLETTQVEDFARISGWDIKKDKNSSTQRTPPKKVILPDSVEGISEDFANHVEIYYSSPERLKAHNPKSFQYIDQLIKQKEKP